MPDQETSDYTQLEELHGSSLSGLVLGRDAITLTLNKESEAGPVEFEVITYGRLARPGAIHPTDEEATAAILGECYLCRGKTVLELKPVAHRLFRLTFEGGQAFDISDPATHGDYVLQVRVRALRQPDNLRWFLLD